MFRKNRLIRWVFRDYCTHKENQVSFYRQQTIILSNRLEETEDILHGLIEQMEGEEQDEQT